MLIVAACAIAFTALQTASSVWHEATYTFTVLVLLVAVLASRYRRGRERAFWFGFAVFGWAFFVLGYRPWMNAFGEVTEDGEGPPYNPLLLTSRLLLFLIPHLRKPTNDYVAIDVISRHTLGIAHLLMTLAVGIAGGVIAIVLWRRPRARWSARSVAVLVGLAFAASVALSVVSVKERPWFARWPSGSREALGAGSPLSLSDTADDREAAAYRFVWVPTFHHPVSVRVDRNGRAVRLRARVLDGMGGYEPGQIAIDRSLDLSGAQWDQLEQLAAQAGFWGAAGWAPRHPGSDIADGDLLVIEGVKAGQYKLRRTNDPIPNQVALCGYMLELTGIVGVGTIWEEYHSGASEDEPE